MLEDVQMDFERFAVVHVRQIFAAPAKRLGARHDVQARGVDPPVFQQGGDARPENPRRRRRPAGRWRNSWRHRRNKTAEPPSTSSRRSVGVSTLSKAIDPTTNSGMARSNDDERDGAEQTVEYINPPQGVAKWRRREIRAIRPKYRAGPGRLEPLLLAGRRPCIMRGVPGKP